jgi:Uma2 family endonuclease
MSAPTIEHASEQVLLRKRMSWEEFLAFDRGEYGKRDEWVDGELVMMPPAVVPHNEAAFNIAVPLKLTLRDVRVNINPGIRTYRGFRTPDVIVVRRDELGDSHGLFDTAVLAVEVLSSSTRSEDLVRKPGEYLAAGVEHYWIVDWEARSIVAYTAGDGHWIQVARMDDDTPTCDITVGTYGTVHLEQADIFI